MLVLPEPVMPCKSLVELLESPMASRERFWAAFSKIGVSREGFGVSFVSGALWRFVIVFGRNKLTTWGSGAR